MTSRSPLTIRTVPASPRPGDRPVMRALVVDDLPDTLYAFRGIPRRIQTVDLRLQTETSAARALDAIRTTRYDIVVSDFRMVEANGVDVLAAAREANPDGYRILMTGYHEITAPIEEIQAAAIDAYLLKPLDVHELMLVFTGLCHGNAESIRALRAHARDLEADASPGASTDDREGDDAPDAPSVPASRLR